MPARANRQVSGSVRCVKRKRGDQWYAKYRLPSGKQIERRLGPAWTERSAPPPGYYSRKTAEAELAAILTDARRGTLPDPGDRSGRTFGDAVDEWLRFVEQEKARRPSTVRDYRNVATGRLLPEFGAETALESIGRERIEMHRRQLLAEAQVSRRTVQKLMVLLHGIFKRATSLGWLAVNPVADVERVNVQRSGEFNVLSVSQVFAVARECQPTMGAAIIVAAFTGLRTGELRAMRWRDVDFAAASIRVQRNKPVGGEEGAPKSGKVRSVPLMDEAARELDQLSRREHFTGKDDLVFCSAAGPMLGEDALRKALYGALADAGIDRKAFPSRGGFTFHDLRHTFGTLAAQVWPLHDVQAFMGHADIQTTLRYTHHIPKRDAAARFSEFVRSEMGESVSRNVSQDAVTSDELRASPGTNQRAA